MKRNSLLILFCLLYCFLPTAVGKDKEKVEAALRQIQEKVKTIEQRIYHYHHQEKGLRDQLATVEKEMGDLAEKERTLKKQQLSHHAALKKLEQRKLTLQLSHHDQLKALSALVRSDFQHHHKERLQLLFEPREWSMLARLNEYYRYFYQARAEHLHEIKNDLLQLQLLQEPLLREQYAINTLSKELHHQQTLLNEKWKHRQKVLASLTDKKFSDQTQLSQLQQQENHLAQLFKTLQETLSITPTYIDPIQNFAAMKKRLMLPIQLPGATLSMIPHSKKEKMNKTYIEAIAGTPVNAIFPGKVIFAEWLRGVGLLIILDHGNGYMSLYGNNQKLYKTLGESVNQGEMIARVGQSGGHSKAGLYFEIRKNGEALDPTPWFEQA